MAIVAGVTATVVLASTAVALKGVIRERYYLWRLEAGDETDRRFAAETLRGLPSVAVVDGLLEVAKDDASEQVRRTALESLVAMIDEDPTFPEWFESHREKELVALLAPPFVRLCEELGIDPGHGNLETVSDLKEIRSLIAEQASGAVR